MRIDRHVLCAIDDFQQNKLDSALMHACFATEGTAKKIFKIKGKSSYKKCLRKYYWIIEPMIGGGINLEETKWNNVKIDDGYGTKITNPDLADIIYHIFRCNNAHGEEVPPMYSLCPSGDGYSTWFLSEDQILMPDRIIWALLAVSVFSKANMNVSSDGDYYLSWGSESLGLGIHKFVIKEWWGREDDFCAFITPHNKTRVKLDKLERLQEASK